MEVRSVRTVSAAVIALGIAVMLGLSIAAGEHIRSAPYLLSHAAMISIGFLAALLLAATIFFARKAVRHKLNAELMHRELDLEAAGRRQAEEALKVMERTVRHHAYHDPLTGLPNRMLFMNLIDLALTQARRDGDMPAVLFIGLDRFKSVNDSLGRDAGDMLLKDVASQLKACVRESDTVSRIGSDEFAFLLPRITHADAAAKIAGKVLSLFHRPYALKGHEFHISASVGISICPDDGEHAEALLNHADVAMYHAKGQGGGKYQFYNPAMNVRALERISLENGLRRTLERGELAVHYQAQIDTRDRRIICAEALVRWQHPELGWLNPSQFIPLAEETGLIIPLDEWVLRTACAQNKAWQEEGHPPLCITVNLSAHQFRQPDLVEMVTQVLRDTCLKPEYLELEITESTAMQDVGQTILTLARLTGMGIRFSIDDFGTGYSSLSYLKKLPIQKLKIDQSFIKGLAKDPDYKAITNAIIAIAHNLKLKVVAEGVETEEQFEFLSESGCDGIQGYLFGEPRQAEEFRNLIALFK
ncbi:MAG TPA: EAL domain-containing protein [Dissulfurispiraceae bacterium]